MALTDIVFDSARDVLAQIPVGTLHAPVDILFDTRARVEEELVLTAAEDYGFAT